MAGWKFVIPPPNTGSFDRFFVYDPIHHPDNTPGIPVLKPDNKKLSEKCCCQCLCCENIPSVLFALVTDPAPTCCGGLASVTITLSKISDYVWRGSGSFCGGSLILTFSCTGDLHDCFGNLVPFPICDGSGGMCLVGTYVNGDCSRTSEMQGADEGCHPTFIGGFSYGSGAMGFCCPDGEFGDFKIEILI